MTQPQIPPLPDDGRTLPQDSVAAELTRDWAVCEASIQLALRREAAITAWLLRRLQGRLW